MWHLYYETNSSATGAQAAWQNVGTNFIFNSSGDLVQPTSSALTIPSLTINGDTLNKKLSAARAASVVKWLVEHGIAPSRLTSEGFGLDRPIDTNDTEEGRRNNRRVEFHLVD